MSETCVDAVISAQTALIAALDARDAGAIEAATRTLAEAVAAMRAQDSWRESSPLRAQIGHALRQSDAARIRINYLADWTRQRIDSIAELRGGGISHAYANPSKIRKNSVHI